MADLPKAGVRLKCGECGTEVVVGSRTYLCNFFSKVKITKIVSNLET